MVIEQLDMKKEVPLKYLNDMTPSIDWKKVAKSLLKLDLNNDTMIFLAEPHYAFELENIISKANPR